MSESKLGAVVGRVAISTRLDTMGTTPVVGAPPSLGQVAALIRHSALRRVGVRSQDVLDRTSSGDVRRIRA